MAGDSKEVYQMNDMDKREDDNETNEKQPLKADIESGAENAKDAGKPNGKEKDGDEDDDYSNIFSQPRNKIIAACCITLVLLILILVIVLLALTGSGGDEAIEDTTLRVFKMIPSPNRPRNMIHYRRGHLPEGNVWPELTEQLEELMKKYSTEKTLTGNMNITACSGGPPKPEDVCFYSTARIASMCGKSYGYPEGNPCVFLQFNYIKDWRPEPFKPTDPANPIDVVYPTLNSYVPVQCKGNTPVDDENAGKLEVEPSEGFPLEFFPYNGHPHYMSPFIAVKFNKPTNGVAIGITCKLWAKNVNETMEDVSAEIPFNLFIE